MHALRHLLTPGTPGYAALKLGAVGSVLGLQHVVRRRAARGHRTAAPPEARTRDASPSRPHPRSRKKRRRRRR